MDNSNLTSTDSTSHLRDDRSKESDDKTNIREGLVAHELGEDELREVKRFNDHPADAMDDEEKLEIPGYKRNT
jgi:hypothetical protein